MTDRTCPIRDNWGSSCQSPLLVVTAFSESPLLVRRGEASRIVADHHAIAVPSQIDDEAAQRAVVEHVIGDHAVCQTAVDDAFRRAPDPLVAIVLPGLQNIARARDPG